MQVIEVLLALLFIVQFLEYLRGSAIDERSEKRLNRMAAIREQELALSLENKENALAREHAVGFAAGLKVAQRIELTKEQIKQHQETACG